MTAVRQINPEYLRRAAQAPDIAALKKRAYDQLRVSEGAYVVDVGCGPAIDTLELAKLVGPTGQVLGIDGDPAMVTEANRAAVEAGLGSFTKHLAADATNLPIETGSVDALFSERLLQHIPWARCQTVVKEMLRVLKPGGRLVIVDTDWSTLSIGTYDPVLERRVMQEHLRGFANPFSGRNLRSLLNKVGSQLDGVTSDPVTIRVTYESARFLLAETLHRGVFISGSLSWLDAQNFIASLVGARDYQMWSAHLTLVVATATKGKRNG